MTTKETATYQFLQFIEFTDFVSWDVEKNTYSNNFVFGNPISLASILSIHREPTSHKEVKKEGLHIIKKIDFGGNLYLRELDEINNYKGNLYNVPLNTIIYSKINVRHGCIYYNTKQPFVVSNEYPCFTFDPEEVSGEYLILLLQSQPFKDQMSSLKVGIGKARVKVDEFLSLHIPLPSLIEQERLVGIYRNKLNKAKELDKESQSIENEINDYILNSTEIELNEVEYFPSGKMGFVEYQDVSRWDTFYCFNSKVIHDSLNESKYDIVPLGSVIDYYQYGLSLKSKEVLEGGVPFLRMNNIKDGKLNITKLKYVPNDKSIENYILDEGDLLFNRTNSKELVGKTCVFNEDETYTFASYLIRVKINPEKADVEYINYLFNSKIIRFQIDLISRQVLGQANINSTELRELLIPLPKDIKKQQAIAKHLKELEDKMIMNIKNASTLREQSLIEFENTIFQTQE